MLSDLSLISQAVMPRLEVIAHKVRRPCGYVEINAANVTGQVRSNQPTCAYCG